MKAVSALEKKMEKRRQTTSSIKYSSSMPDIYYF
jgi:hypothetical protein